MLIITMLLVCLSCKLDDSLSQYRSDEQFQAYKQREKAMHARFIKLAESSDGYVGYPRLPAFKNAGKLYRSFCDKHIGLLGLADHPTMDAINTLLDNIEFRAKSKPFAATTAHVTFFEDHPAGTALLKLGRPAMDALLKRMANKDYDEGYHSSGMTILVEYYGEELAIERLKMVIGKNGGNEALHKCIEAIQKHIDEISKYK